MLAPNHVTASPKKLSAKKTRVRFGDPDLAVNTRLKHAGLSRDVSFKQILVGRETFSKYSFGISSLSFSIQMKNGSNKLT